jgi:hypothetical protein
MATRNTTTKPALTVTREELRRDPSGTFKRVAAHGRVVVTDAEGHPVAIISSPTERIAVPRH